MKQQANSSTHKHKQRFRQWRLAPPAKVLVPHLRRSLFICEFHPASRPGLLHAGPSGLRKRLWSIAASIRCRRNPRREAPAESRPDREVGQAGEGTSGRTLAANFAAKPAACLFLVSLEQSSTQWRAAWTPHRCNPAPPAADCSAPQWHDHSCNRQARRCSWEGRP
jgi:hypothetical protein